MKAAVYLRVSSKNGRQDEANQEPDCVRLCNARGWEPVVFRERESGAKYRPEWRSMLDQVRRGYFGAVVFWALDRIGRKRIEIAHDLGELFRWNVLTASVQDAWVDQPPGPMRDLLVQVMAWNAEGERAKLIQRTRAGLDAARARGVRLGRRPVLSDAQRAKARELRQTFPGWTMGQIARAVAADGLGTCKPQTLRSFLARVAS